MRINVSADCFFFFNDTATTEIYTLSLHDALPIFVLRGVARRLQTAVRPSDTVARLGGDEFVVLVEQADPDAVEALAGRLRTTVTEALDVRGAGRLRVGASIGSAWSEAGAKDVRTLLHEADEAMYRDKRSRTRRP